MDAFCLKGFGPKFLKIVKHFVLWISAFNLEISTILVLNFMFQIWEFTHFCVEGFKADQITVKMRLSMK